MHGEYNHYIIRLKAEYTKRKEKNTRKILNIYEQTKQNTKQNRLSLSSYAVSRAIEVEK